MLRTLTLTELTSFEMWRLRRNRADTKTTHRACHFPKEGAAHKMDSWPQQYPMGK
jgi:hypothetical protein